MLFSSLTKYLRQRTIYDLIQTAIDDGAFVLTDDAADDEDGFSYADVTRYLASTYATHRYIAGRPRASLRQDVTQVLSGNFRRELLLEDTRDHWCGYLWDLNPDTQTVTLVTPKNDHEIRSVPFADIREV